MFDVIRHFTFLCPFDLMLIRYVLWEMAEDSSVFRVDKWVQTSDHLQPIWFVIECNHSVFIFAPCFLLSSKSFIYQEKHFISVLENIKIYIKTYIKIAPTCFGLRPSSGSLHRGLAKVAFIKSVRVRLYGLCGCMAACCIKSMVVCCVQNTAHSTHTNFNISFNVNFNLKWFWPCIIVIMWK